MLEPGSRLGRYEVVAEIGRGGMAAVYKALQPALDRHVAIKVLPDFFASDPLARERFQVEARAIARLRHPSILSVFDYGEEAGVAYLVTELVEGGTMAEQLGHRHSVEDTARALSPIANALDHAHREGVLHRDVKPANILISPVGGPILSDFGLARLVAGDERLTVAGTTLGTPEYMAPEQGLGEDVTGAADIYALGVIAYELLTGTPPFSGPNPVAVLLDHVRREAPSLEERHCRVPAGVEAAMRRVLAKDPKRRHPSAVEFVADLFAAGGPAARVSRGAAVVVQLRPSAELAAQGGDWREQVRRLRDLRERYLTVYGGRDCQAFGDGMVACFEGILPAVRCSADVRALARGLGLEYSGGVAYGEIERIEETAGGAAVAEARRLSELAPPGEIVVAHEVEELVRGFGPEFEALDGDGFRLLARG